MRCDFRNLVEELNDGRMVELEEGSLFKSLIKIGSCVPKVYFIKSLDEKNLLGVSKEIDALQSVDARVCLNLSG